SFPRRQPSTAPIFLYLLPLPLIPPLFLFNDPAPTEISTLSLHDALPIFSFAARLNQLPCSMKAKAGSRTSLLSSCLWVWTHLLRSEEHTSELQSLTNLVCRLLLEKKKTRPIAHRSLTPTSERDITHCTRL